jgi:hypothetical protein
MTTGRACGREVQDALSVDKTIIPNTQPGLRCHVVTVWCGADGDGAAQVAVREDSIIGWEICENDEVWPVTVAGSQRRETWRNGGRVPVIERSGREFCFTDDLDRPYREMSIEEVAREAALRFLPPDVVDRLRVIVSEDYALHLVDSPLAGAPTMQPLH